MLQQTQVDTVIPYYHKFLKRFPDIFALAQSPIDEVLNYWQGLGYYRRAKHLHETSKYVAEHFNGAFPQTASELLKLKGFGPYTSASLASIAFGENVACIDGNVRRVVSRLLASHEPAEKYAQVLLYTKDLSLIHISEPTRPY